MRISPAESGAACSTNAHFAGSCVGNLLFKQRNQGEIGGAGQHQEERLCSTISFGRTLRSPKTLATTVVFPVRQEFLLHCGTDPVVVETIEGHEQVLSGDQHSRWLLSFRSRLTSF